MKMDPNQSKGSNPGPLGAAFPHSYEFHTKRKMFDKGPEVGYVCLKYLITITLLLVRPGPGIDLTFRKIISLCDDS